MTWKSTVLLSGAGLIATWFASAPPSAPQGVPAQAPTAVASGTDTTTPSDINQQAERLRSGLQPHDTYRRPTRNLFRFEERRTEALPRSRQAVPPPVETIPPSPTVRLMLSGIAERVVGGDVVRSAIISAPQDVFVVGVGEQVAGEYRVENVTADAVDLVRIADGIPVRLVLKP